MANEYSGDGAEQLDPRLNAYNEATRRPVFPPSNQATEPQGEIESHRNKLFVDLQSALDAFGSLVNNSELTGLGYDIGHAFIYWLKEIKLAILDHGIQENPRCDQRTVDKATFMLFEVTNLTAFPVGIENLLGELLGRVLDATEAYVRFATENSLRAIHYAESDRQKQKDSDREGGFLI
ncbi:hypothetical protein L207DRAFT_636129 [Hyaloscypha variabilis F]|uniref:Uncharacterized protein n=1 Tax=Hyaloscypha variabilis (strain UAMH 11265 / GT02V1 / F) TaxID=1149755 RepID=A0A2J6RFY9_HYAVF|nr:hypothetical protein L207DRAFT_636129 [Hyaloscypha variabilis F]